MGFLDCIIQLGDGGMVWVGVWGILVGCSFQVFRIRALWSWWWLGLVGTRTACSIFFRYLVFARFDIFCSLISFCGLSSSEPRGCFMVFVCFWYMVGMALLYWEHSADELWMALHSLQFQKRACYVGAHLMSSTTTTTTCIHTKHFPNKLYMGRSLY